MNKAANFGDKAFREHVRRAIGDAVAETRVAENERCVKLVEHWNCPLGTQDVPCVACAGNDNSKRLAAKLRRTLPKPDGPE